jgi:hypothetical protein
MFERFTQQLRRAIFFARYEAGNLGSPCIDTEHLLLGLLREDASFRDSLPAVVAAGELRKRIEERVPQGVPVGTAVDMPLSPDAKRALDYSGEECQALKDAHIDCRHLVLGLLRIETSTAAVLLKEYGIEYQNYRKTSVESPPTNPPAGGNAAGPLAKIAADLQRVLDAAIHIDEQSRQRLKRAPWTRKEALGHLIDWAAAHQQWFARALTQSNLTDSGYPEDTWLGAQRYADVPCIELQELWSALNRMLVHVIAGIPEEKIDTPCRIGAAEPIPLQELVRSYVAHCDDIIGQLGMRG